MPRFKANSDLEFPLPCSSFPFCCCARSRSKLTLSRNWTRMVVGQQLAQKSLFIRNFLTNRIETALRRVGECNFEELMQWAVIHFCQTTRIWAKTVKQKFMVHNKNLLTGAVSISKKLLTGTVHVIKNLTRLITMRSKPDYVELLLWFLLL